MNEGVATSASQLLKREPARLVAATGIMFDALGRLSPTQTVASVLESHRGGVWGDEAAEGCGYPVLRSTNMRGNRVDPSEVAWREIPQEQAERCTLRTGDILVTKSSGSSDLVGKSVLFIHPGDERTYLFSNFTHRLRPKSCVVEPDYLAWFLRSPQALGWRSAAQQTAVGLRNLQMKEFLSQRLPTPPLQLQRMVARYFDALEAGEDCGTDLPAELQKQRRIVGRIEELAAHIREAQSLRQQAAEEAEGVCRAILASDRDAKPTAMHELVRLRPPDVVVQPQETYQFAGVYCFGRGVFRAQAKSGLDFAYPRLTRLHAGDFVYPKLMAWEGAFGGVPFECDGCVVSTEFPVFEVIAERVFPEVLDTYFRTPAIWPEIAGVSTGTNVRRRRLNPNDFLAYRMPLPSRTTQERLRQARCEVDGLKRLQAESMAELDALLPSILDRAFKGEM